MFNPIWLLSIAILMSHIIFDFLKTLCHIALYAKAKGHAYDNLYARLETKEGEKELYRLTRQRDRAGKDVQHVRVLKDENGNVMVKSEAVLKRQKEYFEKLINEKNNKSPRTEEAEVVNKEVNCIGREEVKNALRRMKKGKVVGPDELPVEV